MHPTIDDSLTVVERRRGHNQIVPDKDLKDRLEVDSDHRVVDSEWPRLGKKGGLGG